MERKAWGRGHAGVARRLLGWSGQPSEVRARVVRSGKQGGHTHTHTYVPDIDLYTVLVCLYVIVCVGVAYACQMTQSCLTFVRARVSVRM